MVKNDVSLLEKIREKKAKIAILGLGYVGLPLAVRFAEVGFQVIGIDVDEAKVNQIRKGISPVEGISLRGPVAKAIRCSVDSSLLQEADAAVICVPTPLSKTRDPDLSFVLEAARVVASHLQAGKLVVLESTTYPGTTRELLLPVMEETGLKVGNGFFLGYSPERIDPGNQTFNLVNTPKVVAGVTKTCLKLTKALYGQIVEQVVPVSSTDSAETVKLLENVFGVNPIGWTVTGLKLECPPGWLN